MNPIKDAWRRTAARLRAVLRRTPPAYLAEDDDVVAPELAAAADMRSRMFPGLSEYAVMRLGADAPSERALADALERSERTIPANYIGEISLVSCPCTEVIRFVPFENVFDLTKRGWTVIESFYADYWRVRRWTTEAAQQPPPPVVAKSQEKTTT